MHSPNFPKLRAVGRRFPILEARIFVPRASLPTAWAELLCSGLGSMGHDPEDTRTPPAPGAIQIGPLDVP